MKTKNQIKFEVAANITMIFVTLMALLPFLLVFISSITDENELIKNGYSFFPGRFSLYAYEYIIKQGGKIFRAYCVTITVTCLGTAANILISSMLAFGLSLKRIPGLRAVTFFVVFTMLFNGGLVPTYLMYTSVFNV